MEVCGVGDGSDVTVVVAAGTERRVATRKMGVAVDVMADVDGDVVCTNVLLDSAGSGIAKAGRCIEGIVSGKKWPSGK